MKENWLNYIPLKLYRYLRWRKWTMPGYRRTINCFTKEYADLCLAVAKAQFFNHPVEKVLEACDKKDAYIISHLESVCGDVIESYKHRQPMPEKPDEEKRIWVFWWTGEENAPPIVKACIKSIRANAAGHEVVLLDASNYRQYVDFPDYFIEKHDRGQITHAAFSDTLRMSLLAQYGGVWIDATVFLSQPLPDSLFTCQYYTLKTVDWNAYYYSKSRWCSFFQAGSSNFPLFSFVRDMMLAYWEQSDVIIDYLMVDYLIGLACKHCDEVARMMEQIPENNTQRSALMRAINEPYDETLFSMLEQGDTFASKLSWRYGNPQEKTADGTLTNYGYLLNK